MRSKNSCLAAAVALALSSSAALADDGRDRGFFPDSLIVSRTKYDNNAGNIVVGTVLPPGCAGTTGGCAGAGGATNDGTYPAVWNNDLYDGSFGLTARIFLDELTPFGFRLRSLAVPADHLVTSFSSKSELALNLSLDGRFLTFMGYFAPLNAIDVSNSNTPAAIDATNPVGQAFHRAVARVDAHGHLDFTLTDAYSGNNGRAAILDNSGGADVIYTAGNAGNGANPQPNGVVLGAGSQFIVPADAPEAAQVPSLPAPLASFSVTELGVKADKIGKDDNFRGLTIFDDVVYYTKGSGGNGVNSVYFVDTSGSACPNGVGIPAVHAKLPTSALNFNAATLQTTGLPSNMCILAGFPTVPNKSATVTAFPFGIWFADKHTLYLADEGDAYTGGTDLYTHAAGQTTAGLQKWTFDTKAGTWSLAYVITGGLNLGVPYTVAGYPAGDNSATGLPWAPATDGLRNITGRLDRDGIATVWAITSTISGNGDVGADPNRLVAVRDFVDNLDAGQGAQDQFITLQTARFGEALRGVAFAPGSTPRY